MPDMPSGFGAELAGSALFPARDERQHWDDILTRDLIAASERVTAGAVTPDFDIDAFRRDLTAFDFTSAVPFEDAVGWTIDQLEHGVTHMTHRRYFGLFNPAPTFPAQVADRIAAAFNPQLATFTTSPAAVEIEAHVIRSVAQRAGLPPESGGHFTTGGAEANYTALICALTRANPQFGENGARAFAGDPIIYISKESHLAWFKIAHQAGIGRAAVRLMPTDGTGRLDPQALAQAVAADRDGGNIPIMVVATAGTTNAGMIDPLHACAEIAGKYGMWCHVDAAWAGALIASPTGRDALAGIEHADSVTIDAHKWFAATMGCGMFLTRHPPVLSLAFQVSTGYMPSNLAGRDPYVMSMQWSRRFLGLRLFLSLAVAGWDGYASHVDHAIEMIARLRELLTARGWLVANQSRAAVLCIEPPPGSKDAAAIVAQVLASGRAWISLATFEGRRVIRICVTHGETGEADIAALVEALEAAR